MNLKELSMPDLTRRQRWGGWYMCISIAMLGVGDDAPLWVIILVVLNFANAARVLKNNPLPKIK